MRCKTIGIELETSIVLGVLPALLKSASNLLISLSFQVNSPPPRFRRESTNVLSYRAPARSAIHQLSKQTANGSENIAWCNSSYQQQSHAICCYLSKLQGSELLVPRYNLTYINIMLHYMIIIIIIMIMIIIIS